MIYSDTHDEVKELPRFGAPVLLRFSSLRYIITPSGGVEFDHDVDVIRRCTRVRDSSDPQGWRWQIVQVTRISSLHDWLVDIDEDILIEYGSELDAEIVKVSRPHYRETR